MKNKKLLIALLPMVIIAIILLVSFIYKKLSNKNEMIEEIA